MVTYGSSPSPAGRYDDYRDGECDAAKRLTSHQRRTLMGIDPFDTRAAATPSMRGSPRRLSHHTVYRVNWQTLRVRERSFD